MTSYWIGRILQAIPLWIGASILVFVVLQLAPGDPATILADPSFLTDQQLVDLRDSIGLNDPLPVQYVKMMSGIFTGELRSFRTQESTMSMILDAMPTTFSVAFVGMVVAVLVGLPLGVAAGRRPGSLIDRVLSAGVVTVISLPAFVLALLLIRLFAEQLSLLPASGIRPTGATGYNPIEMMPHLVLPAVVTSFPLIPILARYTRDAVQDTLAEDFVRTAYAKGLAERAVLMRHVVRNALVPVVSVVGILTPLLLGGTVIVEWIFELPGIGRITVQAALQRDYPVVMSTVLFSAVLVIAANLIVDFLYGVVDPRIRLR
ncbi:MAG: ABC transporter permease [Chloroflexi bacterium]|nr:ABC transporter permease [Chloroflexota bacterium]